MGQRDAGPRKREGHERLDRSGSAERERPARKGVAGGVANHERRKVRRIVERAEARPEAADVTDPVERGAEEGATMHGPLTGELAQHVHGIEPFAQGGAPAALVPPAVT